MGAPRSPLKPLPEALEQLLSAATPLQHTERLPTLDADGRVLATRIVSELHVPPQDNSSMDGYAVRCSDIVTNGVELTVSQRIAAGESGAPLQAGTIARTFTGAPVPSGADAIVMQEDCEPVAATAAGVGDRVRVNASPTPGQWIRKAGEDVSKGACVLERGSRLGPAQLGLAASIGHASLEVFRRPKVALFSTGDELVMPGTIAPQDMPAGAIYNSNRFFLNVMLRRLGCEVTDLGIVPDQLEATKEALQNASATHDLILTSGGVSVGEEDHIKPAVQALGHLDLWQIAIKPGKPFAHGRVGSAHFIGLPGNPVSSFVTFLLLVRPFLMRLQGIETTAPVATTMRADFDWLRPDKRQEFLRVRRNVEGGLDLYPNQSSGVLTSAVWADGMVDNPPGRAIATGDLVRFIAFSDVLA